MSSSIPPTPVSPFQWNAGGWFGAQCGGTLWLLLGAGMLFASDPVVGATWLVAFLLANALGIALWRRRAHLSAYVALQLLLLGLFVVSVASIATADWGGQLPFLVSGSTHHRAVAYGSLLVFPAVMLVFFLRERFGESVHGTVVTEEIPRDRP